jgi:hypothetical protein
MQAQSIGVSHLAVIEAPAHSILASACESTQPSGRLEFVFSVPPTCALTVRLLFADPGSTERFVSLYANSNKIGGDYDTSQAPAEGDALTFGVTAIETGLLELVLQPTQLGVKALVNAIQVIRTGQCDGTLPTTPACTPPLLSSVTNEAAKHLERLFVTQSWPILSYCTERETEEQVHEQET